MNIVSKIMEMVEHCREEVMIAVPQAGELIVKQALPKLRQLHDKGIIKLDDKIFINIISQIR